MTSRWKESIFLTAAALVVLVLAAALQPAPGYMDAEYYYAGGLQLAGGRGFTQPFLWNYLDQPEGLPHPAFTYWMPAASILAAAGMKITGATTFLAARWPFVLLAAFIPLVTLRLAEKLGASRGTSLFAGWLAVFPGYYLVFTTLTETFVFYMLGGAAFFLILSAETGRLRSGGGWPRYALFGLVAGGMHAARADGLLWLGMAALVWMAETLRPGHSRIQWRGAAGNLLALGASYLFIIGAWYGRNVGLYGTLMPPGGSRTLWMTDYDQTFTYSIDTLTPENWLAAGWQAHLSARWNALWMNLKNLLAVQGEVFLLPLIAVGLWQKRADKVIRFGVLGWALTLVVMTIVFPFSGARGGFLHSGAAFQPLFWACAAVGLEEAVRFGARKRGWGRKSAGLFFSRSLVVLAAAVTVVVFWGRVISPGFQAPGWTASQRAYAEVDSRLTDLGIPADAVFVVNNPPGFYLATSRSAIVIPDGDEQRLLAAARRFGAGYLVLDENNPKLAGLYQADSEDLDFLFIETIGSVKLYQIRLVP